MFEQRKIKRERGANYPEEDSIMLVELVTQYKNIIENKSTGGLISRKKQDAWRAITKTYNANCSVGPRSMDQLKTKYDNMKQTARKNVDKSNKIEYMDDSIEIAEQVTQENLAEAMNNRREIKILTKTTDGGPRSQKPLESEAKILAIIQDSIDPLRTVYFKDDDASCSWQEPPEVNCVEDSSSSEAPYNVQEIEAKERPDKDKCNMEARRKVRNRRNIQMRKRAPQFVIQKNMSAGALKKMYLRKKCQNALLEEKKLNMQILHMKQKQKLELMILNKQLDDLN